MDGLTKIILDPEGDLVSCAKALQYAEDNVGNTVRIGTDTMLAAFRYLKAKGTIKELEVEWTDGSTCMANDRGQLKHWAVDCPITSVMGDFLTGMISQKYKL